MILDKAKGKYVLITENHKLEQSKDDAYVLTGQAAIFGQENNNGRIYEETEYLPHMKYLNDKIGNKRLTGELDHPEKFDVSLQNASHLIESLDYDKDGRQVQIKVRLLDTPNGRIAKSLVDAGIPISISSRAAGIVESNKKVKIKRIFTYDLVADPGFENAQLSRVNESQGSGEEDNIGVFEMSKSLYDSYESLMKDEKEVTTAPLNESREGAEYATIKEIEKFSQIIGKDIKSIKEEMDGGAKFSGEEKEGIFGRLAKLEHYCKYLAKNLDKNIQYSEQLAEHTDKNIEYNKYLANNLDKNIGYTKYIAENVDKNIEYSKYIAESADKNISYSKYLALNLDKTIGYTDYLGEEQEKNIEYAEYITEKLDKNITYAEYIAESVNRGEILGDAKPINESESTEVEDEEIKKEAEEKDTKKEELQESVGKKFEKLTESVDDLLSSVKKKKTENKVNEGKYSFFRLLSDEKREEFLNLDETEKQKVEKSLNENSNYESESDIVKLWENAQATKTEELELYMELMPEAIKEAWNSLDESNQSAIHAQAKGYRLQTAYQVKNFWQTRPLYKQNSGVQRLTESENSESKQLDPYKENLAKELKRRGL